MLQFVGDLYRMFAPELSRKPLEQALAAQREFYGPHHPVVGETLISLGTLALNQGEWPAADGYLGEGVAILRQHPSAELPGSIARLGDARRLVGQLDDAEALERESLALFIAADGPQSLRSALAISRLARVLVQRGRYSEAEAQLRGSLALTANEVAAEPTTLNTMLALAQLLREGGEKFEEAAELYRRVGEAATGTSGSRPRQAAVALVGRAMILLDLGDADAAAILLDGASAQAQQLMQDEFDYDDVPHLPEAVRQILLVDAERGATRLDRARAIAPFPAGWSSAHCRGAAAARWSAPAKQRSSAGPGAAPGSPRAASSPFRGRLLQERRGFARTGGVPAATGAPRRGSGSSRRGPPRRRASTSQSSLGGGGSTGADRRLLIAESGPRGRGTRGFRAAMSVGSRFVRFPECRRPLQVSRPTSRRVP